MTDRIRLESRNAALQEKLRLLTWKRSHEEGPAPPPWPHAGCIWRDELDVRKSQLEKITAQLARTNSALDAAQSALELQRARHEETKHQHRSAEAQLQEADARRRSWQLRYGELRHTEEELQQAS